jgi:hypothetical protein
MHAEVSGLMPEREALKEEVRRAQQRLANQKLMLEDASTKVAALEEDLAQALQQVCMFLDMMLMGRASPTQVCEYVTIIISGLLRIKSRCKQLRCIQL